jgi:plastocyanin
MRRGGIAIAAAAAAALAAPAAAQMAHDESPPAAVSIGYAAYAPMHLTVLTGDAVRWTNDSVRKHTVTAEDASFDSGHIFAGDHYERRFDAAGTYPYYCRLHAGIVGDVEVEDVLLSTPAASAAPGRPFPLHGRAVADPGATVSIQADGGDGYQEVAIAKVDDHHAFAATVTPQASATYRAVSGEAASAPVQVLVFDRALAIAASGRKGATTITATATPASPGATVVLQLYLPERFGWWPVRRAKLDAASQARFRLHLRRTVRARVRLTLPDGATPLAESAAVRVGPKARP